ncbi:YgiT-type zinc finger protein [Priestia megaterium]|uniref:YgiT-type zinc finger protein n=1 Tax=Priestia megaterium TaxID=1404 RepID=UPI002E1B3B7B|nr:YgiT-type zinc finger protein [Priestia megaterium]
MGALTMATNSNQIKDALNRHEVVRDCLCCSEGLMIPSTTTFKKTYKGDTLIIENVPIFECQNNECKEITYPTGTLLKAIRLAKENYDTSGEVVYKIK